MDPIEEGLPVERGRDQLHEEGLDEPDDGADEHGGEEPGDVVEDPGGLTGAADVAVEELGPGDEHEREPEADLEALLEPEDEVEHLGAQQEVALDDEYDDRDEPLAEEVAGEDGDDHDAPLPDLQPPQDAALQVRHDEADDEQAEEEDEHAELEAEAGPAAAPRRGRRRAGAVLVAEEVLVLVGLRGGVRRGDPRGGAMGRRGGQRGVGAGGGGGGGVDWGSVGGVRVRRGRRLHEARLGLGDGGAAAEERRGGQRRARGAGGRMLLGVLLRELGCLRRRWVRVLVIARVRRRRLVVGRDEEDVVRIIWRRGRLRRGRRVHSTYAPARGGGGPGSLGLGGSDGGGGG